MRSAALAGSWALLLYLLLAGCAPHACRMPADAPGFVYDPSTPGHAVQPAGISKACLW